MKSETSKKNLNRTRKYKKDKYKKVDRLEIKNGNTLTHAHTRQKEQNEFYKKNKTFFEERSTRKKVKTNYAKVKKDFAEKSKITTLQNRK